MCSKEGVLKQNIIVLGTTDTYVDGLVEGKDCFLAQSCLVGAEGYGRVRG